MVVKKIAFLLLALICSAQLAAQNVKVTASLRNRSIGLSDQLQLDLKISSDKKLDLAAPTAPKIPEFSYRNVVESSSTQSSWINGVFSNTHTKTFTYIYLPQKTGVFSIQGFKLRLGGRDYGTPDLSVEVKDSAAAPPPAQQHNFDPWYDPFGGVYPDRSRGQGESFLLCLPETQTVWLGEPAIVSYYIYTDQQVDSFFTESEKDYPGYGKSGYEQPQSLSYEDVQYQNRRFQRALIKRSVIYPQSTGRLQMPTLTGRIQFSGFYSFLNRNAASSPAYINVRSLPPGRPAGFTGAVGNFSVSHSYSSSKITLGEALTCTIQISGRGNFSQFTSPAFGEVENFQISEPGVEDKLRNPIEGERRIIYTLLPRATGEYQLPGVTFSWFDTVSGSYKLSRGQPFDLKVKQGNVLSYFSGLLEGDSPKTLNPLLNRPDYPNFRAHASQPWFWLFLAACLLSLAVSGIVAYNKRLSREDPVAFAQKTASRLLNRYLRRATTAAENLSQEFYPLAESGLGQYLARKYGVSQSLGTEELLAALRQQELPSTLLTQLEEFLLLCQQARYMPGGAEAGNLDAALLKLRQLVQSLSRWRPGTGNGKVYINGQAGMNNASGEER
ncbi:MAG: BatD family protein [Candidatus Cloacimonetes bacterium]|nr:BatD family protein [Candidatus Cloacimonadota bacterium]